MRPAGQVAEVTHPTLQVAETGSQTCPAVQMVGVSTQVAILQVRVTASQMGAVVGQFAALVQVATQVAVVGLQVCPVVQRVGTSTQVGTLQVCVAVLQIVTGAKQSASDAHPGLHTGVAVLSQYYPVAQGCPTSAQVGFLQT